MIPNRPSYKELLDACAEYVQLAQWDTDYEVAHKWVELHWDDALRVAGGIRILEETWNRYFYNPHGIFSMERVTQAIEKHRKLMSQLRVREVETFSFTDEELTQQIWDTFFEALMPMRRRVSPYVATAKAMHLLVPSFFVALDRTIAKNYGCTGEQPKGYIKFQYKMAEFARHVLDTFVASNGGNYEIARATICGRLYVERTGSHYTKSLAKLLDEYNWVKRKEK